MNSIRTKITLIIVIAVALATGIAIFLGVNSTVSIGETSSKNFCFAY